MSIQTQTDAVHCEQIPLEGRDRGHLTPADADHWLFRIPERPDNNADFVELYNRGTTPADLANWSLQYASAAGNSWTSKVLLTGMHVLCTLLVGVSSGLPLFLFFRERRLREVSQA